ncbi:secretin N-terminal domain-containing protein [Rhizobacter sp. Root1221]|uniref:secretin N-terminal domain-containing protein n=1 Tax=Rhizobacter sp. Root1221 TaxID=1736433 RepID=UPI0007002D6C|nr:secretin N-terminal domain-containing protein [Rhizobacter sp. Root1221]KQV94750.1 hypothetical protein ASC87_25915 [Rhizobacter sp. Root1221]
MNSDRPTTREGSGWCRRFAIAALCIAQFGCAAQMAFRDGKSLIEAGKTKEGLARLAEASQLAPGSAEYRIAYVQTREGYAQSLLERAAKAVQSGADDEAERLYQEALPIAISQERALAGLRQLDDNRRWRARVQEATTALDKKNWALARQRIDLMASERPLDMNVTALAQRLLDEGTKASPGTGLGAAYRKPITLEFRETPLRMVFEVLSRTSRLNFIFDKDVKTDTRTTIFLRNSTIEAAINWLLLTNQLEQRVLDDNSVLIYPSTQAKQREYQPLVVRSFYLANAEAKNVAASLKSILKSREVVVDEKLNLVVVKDTPDAIRLADKLVAMHDVAEPEVMLEVEILEIKRSRQLDLGVRWPEQVSLSLLPKASGGNLTLEDLRNPTRSMVGVTVGATSISAQQQDADTNILANPRIRVRNREKAKIHIGDRVPNITTSSTATGFLGESINYVDVGLKLEVEPTIYLDSEVAIKIALEVSSITSQQQTKSGSVAYQLGTRTAQTTLRLKDGENQVLAGLINDEDRRTAYKIPGLGELPVLGRLFGTQGDGSVKSEIVLSITPRVLRTVKRPTEREFEAGTEASMRIFPSSGTAAMDSYAAGSPSARIQSTGDGAAPVPSGGPTVPTGGGLATPQASGSTSGIATPGAAPSGTTPSAGVVAASGNNGIQLGWEGPRAATAGQTFSLALMLQSDQPLASVTGALGFDPKIVQVTGVSEGGFMKQAAGQSVLEHRVDAAGQVVFTATRTGASGATGVGALATVQFKVLAAAAAGSTDIRVVTAAPVGVGGGAIGLTLPAAHAVSIAR